MAPNHQPIQSEPEPVSRTYQYRKVMKPMLERKRRARINRCLDELKEIMMVALQTEGEHVAKLEKADILELTVRHLQKLKHSNKLNVRPDQTYIDRFRAGFKHCANEVTHFLDGVDHCTTIHLIKHLNSCVRRLDGMQPLKEVVPMHARPKYFAPNNGQQISQQYTTTQLHYQNIQIGQQHQKMHIHHSPTPPGSPHLIDSKDPNLVWRPW